MTSRSETPTNLLDSSSHRRRQDSPRASALAMSSCTQAATLSESPHMASLLPFPEAHLVLTKRRIVSSSSAWKPLPYPIASATALAPRTRSS